MKIASRNYCICKHVLKNNSFVVKNSQNRLAEGASARSDLDFAASHIPINNIYTTNAVNTETIA